METKAVQSFRLGLHSRTVLKVAAKPSLQGPAADNCCHPPIVQTSQPEPACLALLTNTVCLGVFGGIYSISNIQTGHFLSLLSRFQKTIQEHNLKSAKMHTEVCNPSYVSQNTLPNWKPVYKKKKKSPNVGKGKCEKREGERELCEDKLCLKKYNCHSLFPSFFYPVLWACGLISMTPAGLPEYYIGFITHNSLLQILPVREVAE